MAHDHHAHEHRPPGDLGRSHSAARFDRAFAIAVALNGFVALAELGFGISPILSP